MPGRDDLALDEAERAEVADVFERHSRFIETIALQQVGGDYTEAAEVVQDVALRLCRKLGTFRHSAALRTWLYRVTVNAARDRRSAQRRHHEGRAVDVDLDAEREREPGAVVDVHETLEAAQRREKVRAVVARLPRRERLAIRARFGMGVFAPGGERSFAEVGDELEISRSAAHKATSAAFERLRERLGKHRADLD